MALVCAVRVATHWDSPNRRHRAREERFEPRSGVAYRGVRDPGAWSCPVDRRAAAHHIYQEQNHEDSARPRRHPGQRRNRNRLRSGVAFRAEVRDRQERAGEPAAAGQRRGAVERRGRHAAGRHDAAPHRQATGQRPFAGPRRHRHPRPQDRDGRLQREQSRWRRSEAAHDRGRPAADQHRASARGSGLPLPVRHREEDVPVLRPDRPEVVRRQLRRRGRRQRADHLPVHPERRLRRRRQARRAGEVRLAVRRRRGQPGHRERGDVGPAGRPRRADHHDPLLRRAAHLLGRPGVGHDRQVQGARQPVLRARGAATRGDLRRLHRHLQPNRRWNRRSRRPATSAIGWRCGAASCRSRSPRSGWCR